MTTASITVSRVFVLLVALLFAVNLHAQNVGARVLAVWEPDGLWYPARVVAVYRDSVEVAFDDGDTAEVSRRELRRIDWRVGSRLECNWKNQGKYYGSRVERMSGETIDVLYDDGIRERITISRCRSR